MLINSKRKEKLDGNYVFGAKTKCESNSVLIKPIFNETSIYFREKGFRVLSCSWDRSNKNLMVTASTIKNNDLMGVIHTTWNTLETMWGMLRLVNSAVVNWTEDTECVELDQLRIELATIIRKIGFSDGEYQRGGWKRNFM